MIIMLTTFVATELSAALPPSSGVNKQPMRQTGGEKVNKNLDLGSFLTIYVEKQSPKFTILWNDKFDQQFSDWELAPTQERHFESLNVVNGTTNSRADYQSSQHTLNRSYQVQRFAPNEAQVESFKAGFIETILSAGVILVDSAVLIRKTAVNSSSDSPLYDLDSKEIETTAFQDNTDYLLEVLFVPSSDHPVGFEPYAEIKSVHTGQVIAKVKSEINYNLTKTSWIATNDGFAKVNNVLAPPTYAEMGQELANATISKLLSRWKGK
ncbi:hypothetical protein GLIP_1189 [Aliiglaciecola lipolytica E3]|uniref:Uncharacterized protein n=2 Tax=Aliiglaciecola TaxID=1406885 RepID=K6YRB7_9ALTE|nr:hypothetical protein GLIP_1189 [Aliiglaciecola lipolytica E3]